MPSPLSYDHGHLDSQMAMVLGLYAARTPGCEVVSNATSLMLESAPQPDIAMRLLPESGGSTYISGGLAAGAPELAVEVARSSRAFDLGPKLRLYERAGVREYLAILVEEERVDWRVLEGGEYRMHPHDAAGVFRSEVFPGLWLDEPALWSDDSAQLLATLERGLASRGS